MASLGELKDALLETMEAKGLMRDLKAKIQAEIFHSLDDQGARRPAIPAANMLINELIREYLEYNQCYHTLSVFLSESGHPQKRVFDRRFLADELKVADVTNTSSCPPNTGKLPLLYGLTQKPPADGSSAANPYYNRSSARTPSSSRLGGTSSSRGAGATRARLQRDYRENNNFDAENRASPSSRGRLVGSPARRRSSSSPGRGGGGRTSGQGGDSDFGMERGILDDETGVEAIAAAARGELYSSPMENQDVVMRDPMLFSGTVGMGL